MMESASTSAMHIAAKPDDATCPGGEPSLPPWHASLQLYFEQQHGRTRATTRRHHGPLRVQRMLYPEGPACCHALLLHPPGGIANGDVLSVDIDLDSGAHVLLTTPGAAKWYRGAHDATQHVALQVADDACLEWLPQEAILFDGARAVQHCLVELAPRAALFGWDIVQLGRLAAGEAWRQGHWHQQLEIRREGRRVWLERATLGADDPLRDSPLGLAGHAVFGSAWLTSPHLVADHAQALQAARTALKAHSEACGLTWLPAPAQLLVVRVVGDSGHGVRALFETLWQVLRPWLAGRAPLRPRIWAT